MPTQDQTEVAILQKSILRSKAERARAASPGSKLLDGPRLFDLVRERIKAGMRSRNPDWSAERVHFEFLNQLSRQRRHAEKNVYRLIGYLNDDGTMTPATATNGPTDDR